MQYTRIQQILKKHKDVFDTLEEYDRTREWPLGRKRIDITLHKRMIKRLKEEKARTRKPISRIIEEALKNYLN